MESFLVIFFRNFYWEIFITFLREHAHNYYDTPASAISLVVCNGGLLCGDKVASRCLTLTARSLYKSRYYCNKPAVLLFLPHECTCWELHVLPRHFFLLAKKWLYKEEWIKEKEQIVKKPELKMHICLQLKISLTNMSLIQIIILTWKLMTHLLLMVSIIWLIGWFENRY